MVPRRSANRIASNDAKKTVLAKYLAKYFDVDVEDIEDYEKDTFMIGRDCYQVLDESEVRRIVATNLLDGLEYFDLRFILEKCGFGTNKSTVLLLNKMIDFAGGDANGFIRSLIEKTCGYDTFVNDAFNECDLDEFLPGKPKRFGEYYIFKD